MNKNYESFLKQSLLKAHRIVTASSKNSLQGLRHTFKTQHSYRMQAIMGGICVAIVFLLGKPFAFQFLSISLYVLMLIFELLNTSIETLCDLITQEYNIHIKNIKDIASAGSFLIVVMNIVYFLILLLFL